METPVRLEDREAIRQLQAAYTHRYDGGQLDEFADLFGEHGVLQLGPGGRLAEGSDDISRALAQAIRAAGLRHFTSDELIEFTGPDRAEGTCRFSVHSPSRNFDGTYHDEYVKGPDGWRFARRVISTFDAEPPS